MAVFFIKFFTINVNVGKKEIQKMTKQHSINIRGCQDDYNNNLLFNNVEKYYFRSLELLKHTSSKIKRKSDININGKRFKFFEGGIKGANNFAGVGCIIDSNLRPTFKRINDRICLAVAYTDSK